MDGEIIGIASGESGSTCESHEVYGELLSVGDLVKFKLVVIEVDGEEEEAIKAIKKPRWHGELSCWFLAATFLSWVLKGSSGEQVWSSIGPLQEFQLHDKAEEEQKAFRRRLISSSRQYSRHGIVVG
jgi:hypothetical protein